MTDVEGRAYCEEFAIKLFGNLDAAEKAGGANKSADQHHWKLGEWCALFVGGWLDNS